MIDESQLLIFGISLMALLMLWGMVSIFLILKRILALEKIVKADGCNGNSRAKRPPPLSCDETNDNSGESMGTEYGWLVKNGEKGHKLRYRTWRYGMPSWTADYNEATRYCRRIDAELAHQEDEDAWGIVQLSWDDMTPNA